MVAKKHNANALRIALAAAQRSASDLGPVVKDRKAGDGWRWASSKAVNGVARPALAQHKLSLHFVESEVRETASGWVLTAYFEIFHELSGTAREYKVELPFNTRLVGISAENQAKSLLTAAERYVLRLILGLDVVAPDGEPDPVPRRESPAPPIVAEPRGDGEPTDFTALWTRLVSEKPAIASAFGSLEKVRDMVRGTDFELRRWFAAALGEAAA
ncbi:MAG: hypothetical protein KC636_25925 [Myxococcales bacterium]|nr:hypothetical protein [Myxococcales bacterium]